MDDQPVSMAPAPVDTEIEQMRVILDALQKLDDAAKWRVLRYFVNLYGLRWI